MKNTRESLQRKPIHILAQESLANFLPAKIPVGIPPADSCCNYWEPSKNYIVASRSNVSTAALAVTLAEGFAASGGHLIWIGVAADLPRLCEQLMFRIAGIQPKAPGTQIVIDAAAQVALLLAHEKISKMWIDFCNVEDCGDAKVEQDFLASVASFKPTLIVVGESIFGEASPDPFEILVRQTHALRMAEELRGTNPICSILWHLPMPNDVAGNKPSQPPSLDDPDAASTVKPDVVLFTHRDAGPASKHNAELIVATDAYGSTGTVPMAFDAKRSAWPEFDTLA